MRNPSWQHVCSLILQFRCSGGRIVAIKKVPRNDLVVNNTVRKEVVQIRLFTCSHACSTCQVQLWTG